MAIFIRQIVKNSQNWWFWLQKSSKFEENSKIIIQSLVPQIDHPIALCYVVTTPYNYSVFSTGNISTLNIFWRSTLNQRNCEQRKKKNSLYFLCRQQQWFLNRGCFWANWWESLCQHCVEHLILFLRHNLGRFYKFC